MGVDGPHLIVTPSSTLANWEREMSTWASSTLKVFTFYGTQVERAEMSSYLLARPKKYDVIITTYQVQKSKFDRALFRKLPWKYLVLDEAQTIKSHQSQSYTRLKSVKADHRFVAFVFPNIID
jgi:SNF2 family DNA or RNA helicase